MKEGEMIESKCEKCGTVFQVPKPGKYLCHVCNNTVIVKKSPPLTSPVLDLEDAPEKKDSGFDYDLVTHSFKGKKDSFLSSGSAEGNDQVYTRSSIPWESRKKIGSFSAFFMTIRDVITNPKRFFSSAKITSFSINAAWRFAFTLVFLFVGISFIISRLFSAGYGNATFSLVDYQSSFLIFLIVFLLYVLVIVILIVVTGAIVNLGVFLMGSRTSSKAGQLIYCYALSVEIFSLFPIGIFAHIIMTALSIYIFYEGIIKFYHLKKARAIFVAIFPQLLEYFLLYILVHTIHR